MYVFKWQWKGIFKNSFPSIKYSVLTWFCSTFVFLFFFQIQNDWICTNFPQNMIIFALIFYYRTHNSDWKTYHFSVIFMWIFKQYHANMATFAQVITAMLCSTVQQTNSLISLIIKKKKKIKEFRLSFVSPLHWLVKDPNITNSKKGMLKKKCCFWEVTAVTKRQTDYMISYNISINKRFILSKHIGLLPLTLSVFAPPMKIGYFQSRKHQTGVSFLNASLCLNKLVD